jgi:hypothetical protein
MAGELVGSNSGGSSRFDGGGGGNNSGAHISADGNSRGAGKSSSSSSSKHSPLLLIGDQGTGKNKLTDRLLQVLGLEREYMQLHRDSTVQSLTVVPTLTNGKLSYVDSPLVKAVKHGRVAVIDEADKAPTETVVVLKSLVEDGLMLLSDGRRIASPSLLPKANEGGVVAGPQVYRSNSARGLVRGCMLT